MDISKLSSVGRNQGQSPCSILLVAVAVADDLWTRGVVQCTGLVVVVHAPTRDQPGTQAGTVNGTDTLHIRCDHITSSTEGGQQGIPRRWWAWNRGRIRGRGLRWGRGRGWCRGRVWKDNNEEEK